MSQFRPFVAGLDPSVDIFEEPRESLMTPAQSANVAGGFADPLGLVDIFGMYPEFPERGVSVEEMAMGPRSPSLLENIQNRDYLNSILQLAGVVPGAAGTSKALRQALRAYHGTPHRFPRGQRVRNKKTGETYVADLDSPVHQKILESGDYELIGEPSDLGLFDMSRIGQGEGAQAYGRGLYFAEAEPVAKGYRDTLTPRDIEYEDELYRRYKQAEADEDYIRMEMLERAMMHDKPYEFRELAADVDYDEDYREAASRMAEEIEELNPNLGSLYTVDIDVDPDDMLDWDKPLSEQSEAVQEIARRVMPELSSTEMQYIPNHGEMTHWTAMADSLEDIPTIEKVIAKLDPYHQGRFAPYGDEMMSTMTGGQFYSSLASPSEWDRQVQSLKRGMTRGEEASGLLSDQGIKGIKYLDGDSRAAGDGSSNYVIFDDQLIDIVDRKREGGAVMQPFIPGLDPTIDIFDDPRDAEPLLTPAQTANVGGAFADPLGMIDIFGGYPAFPSDEMSVEEMLVGPRSPSLMENLRQGEYLDAALQAAGAIPIVGGVAKGMRTARAGIRALPIDEQIKVVGSIRESGHQGGSIFAPDLYQQTGVQDVRRAEEALKSNQSDLQNIDQMVGRAEAVNPDFQANIADVAANAGAKKAGKFITLRDGSEFDVEVKTRKSIDDKIQRKGLTPDQFTDGVRTSVYVDSADQAEQVASEIGQWYPSIDRGWQIMPETGYFDRKMNVAITDPKTGGVIIGEVQIKTPEMAEAGEVGHRWYEITRKLEGRYNKDIPPQKYKTYVDARAEQQRIYGGATQAAEPTIVDLLLEKFRLGGLVAR